MHVTTVLQSTRGPFLILTPACVFLAAAAAYAQGWSMDPRLLSLVMLAALAAHVSVNTFNEYFDLRSGLDLNTLRTPFSGGSGALPANPGGAHAVLMLAWVTLGITAVAGLYFVSLRGWALAPLGLLGLLIVVGYTPFINRSPLACLIAPGLGFGLLMVTGSAFVLSGQLSLPSVAAGLVAFFLVNNLLLLNQLPDLRADREAGRRHLPIQHGADITARVYVASAALAYLTIITASALTIFPMLSLLALLTAPLAAFAAKGAFTHGEAIGQFPAHLAANVMCAIVTPIILGATLILSSAG